MTGQTSNADAWLDLLVKAQSGDEAALDCLVARFGPRLHRWASRRLPSSAMTMLETEDLVQDALIAALQHADALQLRSEAALGAYLRQAINNRLLEVYPRRALRDDSRDPFAAPDISLLETAIGAAAIDRYDAALGRLGEEDRYAVILRVELGYEYAEIASALKTPTGEATRLIVAGALTRLAQEMLHGR